MLIINISWESTALKYVSFKTLIILTKGKLKVGVENIVHVHYWFLRTFCSVDGTYYTVQILFVEYNLLSLTQTTLTRSAESVTFNTYKSSLRLFYVLSVSLPRLSNQV